MSDKPMLIFDSHLDIAFCALQGNRDLTVPAATVRTHDPAATVRAIGTCTTTFPELRRGRVGIVCATVMSRIDPSDTVCTGMYVQEQCHAVARGHRAYYEAMERRGVMRMIHTAADLDEMVAAWDEPALDTPIGAILTMEGADPIMDPDQVPEWYDLGLRMVSISHYGTTSYSHGTGTEGGLLPRAKPLLDALREAGIIVDVTHLTDQAFWELFEAYDGPVGASHHNCRALVPGQRQLDDDMIRAIAERGGVIGLAFDVWMMDPGWERDKLAREQLTKARIETAADHVDHIAQLLGETRNVGIGSDLDGGYGTEQSPVDLNTIADLQRLRGILEGRGYAEPDVRGVLSGNWLRLFRENLRG